MKNIQEFAVELESKTDCELTFPENPNYDAARAVWALSTSVPKVIAQTRTNRDVQQIIRLARAYDLPVSVKGGGHDWAGRALCDGVVIDLSLMRGAAIVDGGRECRVGGGARGIDLFPLTDPLGVAPVTGSVGLVGLAGLTLGGGYGSLTGRFGLACDNLVSADVVMADGNIVTAKAGAEEELLWALRGGGGNFGVVTSLNLRLHELASVRSGMILYELEDAETVFNGVAEICESAPDELIVQTGMLPGPGGSCVVAVLPTWSGPSTEGALRIAPLLELGTPLMVDVHERSYGDSRTVFDSLIVNGRRTFAETRWLRRVDSESTRILVEQMRNRPSALCSVLTHEFRGAAARIHSEATAFGFRERHVLIEILAQVDLEAPGDGAAERRWVDETCNLLDSQALPGGYANMLPIVDPKRRANQAYGANSERIAAAKIRFDPSNFFSSAIGLPTLN